MPSRHQPERHEVDSPTKGTNGLSRREINADLTAMDVSFHPHAGASELAIKRAEAREKAGRPGWRR